VDQFLQTPPGLWPTSLSRDRTVTVSSSATLTIESGVVVKFDLADYLTVSGTLNAVGTRAARSILPMTEMTRWEETLTGTVVALFRPGWWVASVYKPLVQPTWPTVKSDMPVMHYLTECL